MNVEVRNTAQGTEYWDTKEKKIRFVSVGKEPDFEVTKDPKSMLVADGKLIAEAVKKKIGGTKEEFLRYLETMNAEQLLAFAKDNDIEIPGNMKKEETVRNHIAEKLNDDE
ncbi:hypothetical protein [Rossellomorea marisflavi]|uniref:hypothetical protein n=1 Tax=Rossellomorea marisflavi TaxID=189381 RepID=UPI00207A4E90|nr:hypothetical protein [Rossellomorea marisflavi]USK91506.1 hypothetical protein LIT29_18630 [Rossellomorea marisflavi]